MDLYSKDAGRVPGCVPPSPSHPARLDAPPSRSEDTYLRPSEVKRRYALSKRCIRKAIKRGDLPTVTICGKIRIPESLIHPEISWVENSQPRRHTPPAVPVVQTLTGAGYDDTFASVPPTPSGLAALGARVAYNLIAAGVPVEFDLLSDDPRDLELNWGTPGGEGYTHGIAEELADLAAAAAELVVAQSNGRS